jgi:hypothetical protein
MLEEGHVKVRLGLAEVILQHKWIFLSLMTSSSREVEQTGKCRVFSILEGVAIFHNDDDFTTLRRHCENKGMSQHRRKIVKFHI